MTKIEAIIDEETRRITIGRVALSHRTLMSWITEDLPLMLDFTKIVMTEDSDIRQAVCDLLNQRFEFYEDDERRVSWKTKPGALRR